MGSAVIGNNQQVSGVTWPYVNVALLSYFILCINSHSITSLAIFPLS